MQMQDWQGRKTSAHNRWMAMLNHPRDAGGRHTQPGLLRLVPALAVPCSPAGQHSLPQRLSALDPHQVRAGPGWGNESRKCLSKTLHEGKLNQLTETDC